MFSLCYKFANAESKSNKTAADISFSIPDSIFKTEDIFSNPGFEDWDENTLIDWSKVIDNVGSTIGNVKVMPEQFIKIEGDFSVKVESTEPFGGIEHAITGRVPLSWSVYPITAKAAIHYAKENGTSAFFNEHSLLQENFSLACSPGFSSAIRNAHVLRLDNNDYIELFSACSTSETSYQGGVYMKRNGGEPSLFIHFPEHRTWAWPGVIDMGVKYVFVTMRIGQDGQQHLYATDVSRDFTRTLNDRLLFDIPATNVQCYSMIALPNGKFLLPIVYADVDKVSSGPWFLDILTTTDFRTVTRLNTPKTYNGRGLMEAYPVRLSTGKVAILCRTNQGHLAKAIYDPVKNQLSEATATEITQPSAGSFAKNLNDNSIILSWLANINMRKILVMAVSDDDMATWQSYHVIMTSGAMDHSMNTPLPYIHQPFIFEDNDGTLICYYEEVKASNDIKLYKASASAYRINNVANVVNRWNEITVDKPLGASSIQLLNVIGSNGIAFFDQPTFTDVIAAFDNRLSIYPNPVRDYLRITSDDPVTSVDIIDLKGSIVGSYAGASEIPMSEIKKGIYFIKLTRGAKIDIVKVIKTE